MPIFHVNGQPIHAIQEGNPNRQVALMLHGWSSSWYALSPLLPILSQRFNVIAVDLPGYGKSPPLPDRVTIPAYADLLAGLIEQVSENPVVLIGHSMGGMISMVLAMRHPILVERMVLICPTVTGNLSTMINTTISPITLLERFGLGSLMVSTAESLFVGLTDRLMRPVSFSTRSGITEQDYMRLREDARRPGQGQVRAECFFAMRDSDLSGQLTKIEATSLVIWGAEDNTVPLRDSGVVADEWPEADLRIIPRAGHWPQFERPDTTRRLVAAFLGLPLLTSSTSTDEVDDAEFAQIRESAQFLAHSDLGNNLNEAQRIRLAAQTREKRFEPGEVIVRAMTSGNEMYVIKSGTVEVWSDPDHPGQAPKNLVRVATLTPGQMTGELSMLDGGARSADLRAGADGSVVLGLEREQLLALCEDDPTLGTRVLWNISNALSLRVRFVLWQLQRASHRAAEREAEANRLMNNPGEKERYFN